jgi:type I restriction enzyme M protein
MAMNTWLWQDAVISHRCMSLGGPLTYLERALRDGHAEVTGGEKNLRIFYRACGRREIISDPEEKVRAEFWAELIYRYRYDPQRIGVEVIVPDRLPRDAADLVVFGDDAKTRPYAVIECKPDGISDNEFTQAVEQAVGNGTWSKLRASYVGVVAGATRRFLDLSGEYGVLEREASIIADLPIQYGQPEEFKYHRGTDLDIQPVSRYELIAAIRKCHQTLWGGGRLSPPSAFGELCKLIFVKIADEQAPRRRGEPYQFQIKTHESSRALAERIRELYEKEQSRDPEVFSDRIRVGDIALLTIVSHLESINLSKTDLDVKGLAFEQFMDGFFKGDFGQYFTPRHIIDFCVKMLGVDPNDRVLDPACGSGGFLIYAMDAVRESASQYFAPGSSDHYKYWHDFASRRLYGIEINDEIARVAKMNMILHDDGHTNIIGSDALEYFQHLKSQNAGLKPSSFDLVITNPPFGAVVSQTEHPYLSSYELSSLGSKGKARVNMKSEIVFLERIIDFLQPSTGRAAIVVPDGILTNKSLRYVREYLIDRCQIIAIVSLPATAFSHYGAGVKASVVFLRRRGTDEVASPSEIVFMAEPQLIGYDATGRDTPDELPQVIEDFRRFEQDPSEFLVRK